MVAKSQTLSFTVPEMLRLELSVIAKTGYYDSTSEFLRDAMRTFLNNRKDLRIAIAAALYQDGKISLGKATEISEVSYEEMKELLVKRGIPLRRGSQTKKEMLEAVERIKKWQKSSSRTRISSARS